MTLTADRYSHVDREAMLEALALMPDLEPQHVTGTNGNSPYTDHLPAEHCRALPRAAIDTPAGAPENGLSASRSGEIGRRAGLKIRWR